jgi:putative flippase GtrA
MRGASTHPLRRAGSASGEAPRVGQRTTIRSLFSFAVVGGLGLTFDVCLLWLLTASTNLPKAGAVTIAFASTYVLNFFLNRRFSFAAESGSIGPQLARFLPQVGLDYVLTLGAVEVLTGAGLALVPARIVAGGTNATVNYVLYRWWTFRRTGQPAATDN